MRENLQRGAASEESHRVLGTEYSECDREHPQPTATSQESKAKESSRQAQPDLREMERYASVFTKPEETDAIDANLQQDATSEESHRVLGTEYPEPCPQHEEAAAENPQPTATSADVITIEHAGHACEVDGYADLTAQQTLAMFALQTGQAIHEAAKTAESESATVYQWLRGDHAFQAAMNRCAGERRQTIQSRLAALASRAADVIDRKVCQGNGRMAVKVLRGLGYLAGRTV